MTTATQWVASDFGGPEVLVQRDVELPPPGPGEVLIAVRASGMNPSDYKRFAAGGDHLATGDRSALPIAVGFEVAGTLTAIGPDTEIATGGGRIGDSVVAFRVQAGYATAVVAHAADVFAKPAKLAFEQAANLLLSGTAAADLLAAARVAEGDTVLLHGGAGAVGMSVLQQAKLIGARVIATAGEANFGVVERFGGIPVRYGDGLSDRVRAAAPDGVSAALDTVGTDEAVDVSLELLEDRQRFASIAAFGRAGEGIRLLESSNPTSAAIRSQARGRLIDYAAAGDLVVLMAGTFTFDQAPEAVRSLAGHHPSGKLALLVDETAKS